MNRDVSLRKYSPSQNTNTTWFQVSVLTDWNSGDSTVPFLFFYFFIYLFFLRSSPGGNLLYQVTCEDFILTLCSFNVTCDNFFLGMTTVWIRAGFFHTRTRLVGQDPRPRPGLFIKRIFSPKTQTRPAGPHPTRPLQGLIFSP